MQLLADAAHAVASDAVSWGAIMGASGLIIGTLGVVAAFLGNRRTPPLAEEVHSKFAKADDVKSLETEFEKKVVALHTRMDQTFATMNGTLLGMAKSLGAIEGKLEMRHGRHHTGGEGE